MGLCCLCGLPVFKPVFRDAGKTRSSAPYQTESNMARLIFLSVTFSQGIIIMGLGTISPKASEYHDAASYQNDGKPSGFDANIVQQYGANMDFPNPATQTSQPQPTGYGQSYAPPSSTGLNRASTSYVGASSQAPHHLAGHERPPNVVNRTGGDLAEGLDNLNLKDIPVGGSISNAPSNWNMDSQAVAARTKVITNARILLAGNSNFFENAEHDIKSATATVMLSRLQGKDIRGKSTGKPSIAKSFKEIHDATPRSSANFRMLTGHLNTAVNEIKIKTSSGMSSKLNSKDNTIELDAVRTADRVLGKLTTVFEHMHTTGKNDFENVYTVNGKAVYPHEELSNVMADNVKDSKFKFASTNKNDEARYDMQELEKFLNGYIAGVIDAPRR
jgi:hypothetical protein